MQASDYIALASLLVALGSLAVSYRAYQASTRLAAAGSETAVLSLINQARIRIGDINLKLQEIVKGRLPNSLNADEKRQVQGMEKIYYEAVETFLNSFELACGMYRDKKLDRERFRRQYSEEVKKLFDEGTPAFKDRLLPVTSPYKALRAVYEEWFNPER